MKVGELIEELKKADPEQDVVIEDSYDEFTSVDDILDASIDWLKKKAEVSEGEDLIKPPEYESRWTVVITKGGRIS